MAYDSPLFHSSLELFAHAIEHFNWGREKDRKFVILHLANAVELIFKDLLLDIGESIYKNPKETITIWQAVIDLSQKNNVKIPHLNKIELLIEERNSIQHRFGYPNEVTTIYFMNTTHAFFVDFLNENYNIELSTILKEFLDKDELESFNLRKITTKNELDKLINFSKIHPVGAALSAFAYLDNQLYEIREILSSKVSAAEVNEDGDLLKSPMNSRYRMTISNIRIERIPFLFEIYEIQLDEISHKSFFELRETRNRVTHGREVLKEKEAKDIISLIKSIEPYLIELKKKIEEDPIRTFDKLLNNRK